MAESDNDREDVSIGSLSDTPSSKADVAAEGENRGGGDDGEGDGFRQRRHLRVYRSSYKGDELRPGNEATTDGEFDFIFVVAHGASFSSAILETNLRDFLKTLEVLKALWFWELKLRIHVELIDWKSVLAPFQNGPMARVIPRSQLEDPNSASTVTGDDLGTRLRSFFADPGAGGTHPAQPVAFGSEEQPATESPTRSPMVTVEREDSQNRTDPVLIPSGAQNVVDFDALFKSSGPRVYFNNTVADVLCYLTPRYGDYLIDQMSTLINKKVQELRNDPSGKFKESKVVLIGHSLGSVLLYEILTGDCIRDRYSGSESDENDDRVGIFPNQVIPVRRKFDPPPRFSFKVDHFFMWGSPLAAFMILNNKKHFHYRHGTRMHTKIYNMFHRQDPIALRLEPLMYPSLEKLPPPVTLPHYKNNKAADLQMAWKKSVEAVVTSGSTLRRIASNALSKMFPAHEATHKDIAAPLVPGLNDKEVKRFIVSNRYRVPDPLDKQRRYGVIGGTMERVATDIDNEGIIKSSHLSAQADSPNDATSRGVSLFLSRSLSEPMPSEPPIDHTAGSRHHHTQGGDEGSFEVAKGDAAGKQLLPTSTNLRSIDNMLKPQALFEEPRPWTARQLVVHVAARIRKSFYRYMQKKLDQEAEKEVDSAVSATSSSSNYIKQRDSCVQAIEEEVELFVSQQLKTRSTRPLKSEDMSHVQSFLDKGKARDLEATEEACRRELAREVKNDWSETEAQGGDQLPRRLDFVISENLHEYLFAPWGLLASHLNYWNCRNTGFFILKQITGFRPRVDVEKRDQILQRSKECAKAITTRIDAVFKRTAPT